MHHRNADLKELITDLNRQWMRAYSCGDLDFLERHMADDYVGTFPDGTVHDKRSEIEAVRAGRVKITEMEPLEMNVSIYNNDAAVLTGRSRIKAVVEGQAMSADFRFTDVWIAREGRWQAVASQVTRIAQ